MAKSLKIAVADDEIDMCDFYRRMLTLLGHEVTVAVQNGRELVDICRTQLPELVVTDVMLPEMDGIDAAAAIWQFQPLPVIVISANRDAENLRRIDDAPIMAVLIKPISRKDLGPGIDLALLRFDQFRRLHDEETDVAQALRDRRVVERAKRLLFSREGMDETNAFQRLRAAADTHGFKVVDAAHRVLASVDFA